jgi:phage minor structural protein
MKKTNILVFDGKTEKLVAMLSNKDNEQCPYKETEVVEQLNKDFTFDFSVPASHEDSKYLVRGNLVGFFDLDGNLQVFQIYKTEEEHNGDELSKVIFSEHLFYEMYDDIVENLRVNDEEASAALVDALASSRWDVGNVDSLGLKTMSFYYSNGVENIQKVANEYGGELGFRLILDGSSISQRLVDLQTRRGSDTGKRFEFRKDMASVKRTVEMDGLKTALYGRGKGEETEEGGYTRKATFKDIVWRVIDGDPVDKPQGQEWVGDPEALTQFGRVEGTRHRFGTFDFDTIDPTELLQMTWEQLQRVKIPLVTYELSVIALEELSGYEHEKVRLGDTVYVIDRDLGITIEARVVEIKRDLMNPENTEIVLGNFIDDITDYNKKIEQIESVVTDRKGVWDKVEDVDVEVDDDSIVNVTPSVPQNVSAQGLFKSIILKWTFDPSISIAAYEVYGSKVNNFTPDSSNLLYRGKSGGHIVEANTNETWYFRIRAINPHGIVSPFTQQFSASTLKIDTPDFELLSIEDALIHSVSADKITFGTLDGNEANIVNINADNINAGKLKGQYLEINSSTTFQAGYDPSTKATPSQVTQAEASAKSYADTKKQEAIDSANTYAEEQAEAERLIAEAYADGIVSDEEQARINDVNAKLQASKTYADQKKQEAIEAAEGLADEAEQNAKDYTKPVMKEVFDPGFLEGKDFWARSYVGEVVTSTSFGTIIPSSESIEGGNVWAFQGGMSIYSKNAIPINVNRTYRVSFRVRQTVDSTTGIMPVYAGVVTLDENFVNITGGAGAHRYCAVTGTSINAEDGWQTFTGLIKGVGDLHDNFRPGTRYVRPMFIVNYANNDGEVEVDFLNFEDVTEIVNIESRVSEVEFLTTQDSIIQTVTESVTFQDELGKKADSVFLQENYVDNDTLSTEKDAIKTDLETQIEGLGVPALSQRVAQVETKADQIDFKFTNSGGVNLLRNSVGYAGNSFWLPGGGIALQTLQNEELAQIGAGSGWFKPLGTTSVSYSQRVSVVNSNRYTLSFYMKKTVDNSASGWAGVGVYVNGVQVEFVGLSSSQGITNGYEKFEYSIDTDVDEVEIRILIGTNSEAVITNLMVNIGDVPLQWTLASGEVYNTNVLMDMNGIRVNSNQYAGYTAITPQEFSGYAEVLNESTNNLEMKRVFTLNKDTTEVTKLKAEDEIKMTPLKVITIDTGGFNGWAFVPDK